MTQAESLDAVSPNSSVKSDAEKMRLRVTTLKSRVEEIVALVDARIQQHRHFLRWAVWRRRRGLNVFEARLKHFFHSTDVNLKSILVDGGELN